MQSSYMQYSYLAANYTNVYHL